MKFKKSQGLSLQVIIIAAIALIVLVVLVFILTGRMAIFGKSLDTCIDKGGERCAAAGECGNGYATISSKDCKDKGEVCCIKVLE